ncbi:MAG: ATP-binding cassette domain-containing protein [Peptoniphilus harei]|uniref:ATP-binding cassette domain-containing protein n=1 Tax=Peptoniphilus harei TaxID=54005 RepID=UPI001897C4E7|nr:ATP-binding cassette domain-containing protein [Peptoniphilus harei]MBS6721209.1 ATP-binding cassette domain-containing protein [Peptoniphilus harei]
MTSTIEIIDLEKVYNDSTIIQSINIEVNKGEIYGLLGRNGAGKTTIMKIILGLVKPTKGKTFVLGKDTSTDEGKMILKKVGCIIETPGFYSNLTGTENLMIFSKLRGIRESMVKESLKMVNLPYNDKKLFEKYSLGMKQRLAIANAIMHKPDILILDEPINGLDPIGIAEVRDLLKSLKKEGVTILISSHILPELENLADKIGIINNGKLIEEIDMRTWSETNNSGIKVFVKNVNEANKILIKNGIKQNDISKCRDGIIITNKNITMHTINKIFAEEDFEVSGIIEEKRTLEEHFKLVTGGHGIG